MLFNRRLDPETGDYVLRTDDADYEHDETIASEAVLRLRTTRGSVPTLPSFGLRKLERLGDNAASEAEDAIREALADLVESADMRGLTVESEVDYGRSQVRSEIGYTDTAGRRRTLTYEHPVG